MDVLHIVVSVTITNKANGSVDGSSKDVSFHVTVVVEQENLVQEATDCGADRVVEDVFVVVKVEGQLVCVFDALRGDDHVHLPIVVKIVLHT